MNPVIDICEMLAARYGMWGLLLMLSTLIMLGVQLYYYLKFYARIPGFRNARRGNAVAGQQQEGISVVILMNNNVWYLENMLPRLMAQDHPKFEIVIVQIGNDADFTDALIVARERYNNIISTKMDFDPRIPISDKMAYNVGIKAANYENILLTTIDVAPVSEKWLSLMAKGFENGEVVLGYCGMEQRDGFTNKIIRCSRVMSSTRWLASAIAGRPYRGIIHNIGFTRRLYFEHKGFGHLNMNLGEDDLFIQQIATAENTSIVMNPNAVVKQEHWGGIDRWWRQRRFYSATERYYPAWAQTLVGWELGSRMLFLLCVIVLVAIMPLEIKMAALGLWLMRLLIVRYKLWQIRRRLGERGLGWAMILYDLFSPFSEMWLSLLARIRSAPGVWR